MADLTRGNLFPKIKNKIHGELIKRGTEYKRNIFTKSGKEWLHSLKIPAIETYLSIMEKLEEEIKKMDKRLKEKEKKFKEVKLLKSLPATTFSAR